MNHLDCARLGAALAAILILSPAPALARHHVPVPKPRPELTAGQSEPAQGELFASGVPTGVQMAQPSYDVIDDVPQADDQTDDDAPRIVNYVRRLFCVEYARLRSGIEIFGDARTWWQKARGQYAETADPKEGAVMVFATTRRMRDGHVAVVSRIVSNREIRVDHANWMRDGRIWLNAPVIDVSRDNDWSQVRVWDTRDGVLGSHIYSIKGFVSLRQTAMR